MHLVVAGATGRAILNWGPLIDLVENRGGAASIVLLESRAKHDVAWPQHHRSRWSYVVEDPAASVAPFIRWLVSREPDVLLLATVVAGVELQIHGALQGTAKRPLIVGAQHGFFQRWNRYKGLSCFDVFLTFGLHFKREVADDSRFVAGALPKLDAIRPRPAVQGHACILFAPQTHFSGAIAQLIIALPEQLSAKILVRPHPAAPALYNSLWDHPFMEVDTNSELNEVFTAVDLVITTGSTLALEALAAGVRVVVLPFQAGEIYTRAGIVAESISVSGVLAILERYRDPEFCRGLAEFLRDTTGSDTQNRSEIAYSALSRLVSPATAGRFRR